MDDVNKTGEQQPENSEAVQHKESKLHKLEEKIKHAGEELNAGIGDAIGEAKFGE